MTYNKNGSMIIIVANIQEARQKQQRSISNKSNDYCTHAADEMD